MDNYQLDERGLRLECLDKAMDCTPIGNKTPAEVVRKARELEGYVLGKTFEDLHYDETTLQKVYAAILGEQLSEQMAADIVNAIQRAGILFRERKA